MEKLLNIFKKHKDIILYCFFGALTTLVNIVLYNICFYVLSTGNLWANIISWIASVVFAYITNKIWVFASRSFKLSTVIKEIISFFGCRVFTGLVDILIMYIAVDRLHLTAWLFKIISNIIVIILNYVASKFFVFKKEKEEAL